MDSFLEAFARHRKERGDRLALWSRSEAIRLSFAQFDERASGWQRQLDEALGRNAAQAATSEADERPPIGLALGNSAAFCELTLALLRSRIPMVAMDGSTSQAQQVELCRRLGIRYLIHRHGRGVVLQDDIRFSTLDEVEVRRPPPGTALVKLTSGSTGTPMGICLSLEGLSHGIRHIGDGMELGPDERVLIAIPLSHSYGFDNGILSLLALGSPLILQKGIFPASLFKALRQSEATFMPLVPPLVRSLGQSAWPDELALRRVICAGGVLHADQAKQFFRRSGRRVQNFYGSTETGGISFETQPGDPEACGTVGQPLPGVDVAMDDEGRVQVESKANLLGYWGQRPLATNDAGLTTVVTGDIGEWTSQGRLRLTGRSADILNVGGRKVSAVRVENALRGLAGVQDVAVVGVDDAVRGERTVAFVVCEQWPLETSSVAANLRPRELRRLETLPYTARGKLERNKLRHMAIRKSS